MKTQEELRKINMSGVMPKVNGKPFRCGCGANVFHHPVQMIKNTMPNGEPPIKEWIDGNVYECNGCGIWYRGE